MSIKEVVELALSQRKIRLEVHRPDNAAAAPGILYLHEIFGLLDVYRKDAEELAARGYVVYLPDLYSDGAARYCVRAMVRSAGRRNAASSGPNREVAELLDRLKADPHCNGKLGMIGMCLTGGFVIQSAMRPDMLAPVVYHHSLGMEGAGVPRDEEAGLDKIQRLQGHWSRVDPFCPAARRDRLINKLGDRVEAHVYNIPHGFRSGSRLTQGSKLAWQRTLRFFDEHLEPQPV